MKKESLVAELLPEDLLWAGGGHASDVVLTALADGQVDIVPAKVRAHVEGCRACTTHLGNAALLSLHAGVELATLEAARAAISMKPEAPPMPRLAIALALVIAALGLVPTLLETPVSSARVFATHDLPLLAGGLETLVHRLLAPGSPLGIAVTYGAATLFVAIGLTLVRLLPKKSQKEAS